MTRDQLLAILPAGAAGREVAVPELAGGAVLRLRPLTLAEMLDQEARRPATDDPAARSEWMARGVVRSLVGVNGEVLLTDDDLPWVLGWPGPVLARLFMAVSELSSLGDVRVRAAEKN